MNMREMLKSPKNFVKKVKFIYVPYQKVKFSYITKKRVKALKENGIETIKKIENALSGYSDDLFYFADYGTLLGIIRDHHFISWDNDLDYGLMIDNSFNWKRFEHHMNKYGFTKVREFKVSGEVKEQTYTEDILTVDFFAKTYENNELVTYGFFRKQGYQYKSEYDWHVRRVKYVKISATKRVLFLGVNVTVPENAEEYLESAYSENWRTPDPYWDDEEDNRDVEVLNILGTGIIKK